VEAEGEATAPRRMRAARWIAMIVALAAIALVLATGWALRDTEVIFRGVRADGVDLGGLDPGAARARLAERLPATSEPIVLIDPGGSHHWSFVPQALGLRIDAGDIAESAWRYGRDGDLRRRYAQRMGALVGGHDVLAEPGVVDSDTLRAALTALAPEVDTPPVDADIRLVGGQLDIRTPVLGHQLDVDGTVARLAAWARDPVSGSVEIAVLQTAPRINDLSDVALAYRQIVSGPVELAWGEGLTASLSVADLRSMVTIGPAPNPQGTLVPSIIFDYEALGEWVAPLAPRVERPARDARFDIDPTTGKATVRRESQLGIRLNIVETVGRIVDAAYTADHATSPAVEIVDPLVPSEALPQIDALEEVANASTSLKGASDGVLHNVLAAVEELQGITLAPGSRFSFDEMLGQVSEATGYDMIAIDGAALSSPSGAAVRGGGLAQVATTVFRAAFWAGLPIDQRTSPPYRIGWLEPPIGLDAATDGSGRDLVFTNDTAGFLVLQLSIDLQREALTGRLYAQPDGRRVWMEVPAVGDVKPAPSAIVRADARLGPGERRQVGWAREGATAVVERIVRNRDAETRDQFASTYEPASDVFLVAP
jgi:vancomycin resistance protein YoaR